MDYFTHGGTGTAARPCGMLPRMGGYRIRLTSLALVIAVGSGGCGSGGDRVTTPTAAGAPTPTPLPTPTPRQTATIDAEADFVQYSPLMARLVAPQSFEFTVRPLRINLPYPSSFSHTVEVWFSPGTTVSAANSIGFSATWLGNGRWSVDSYTPSGGWYYGHGRFALALGDTATFRITKHNAGVSEFFVNGVSLEAIDWGTEVAGYVRTRVVGSAAEISWVPTGGLSGSALPAIESSGVCLFCAPGPHEGRE